MYIVTHSVPRQRWLGDWKTFWPA